VNPEREARLPVYNPSTLALTVQRILGESGVTTVIELSNVDEVVSAAANLLRALGVAPVTRRQTAQDAA
jgi:hypothetical protein